MRIILLTNFLVIGICCAQALAQTIEPHDQSRLLSKAPVKEHVALPQRVSYEKYIAAIANQGEDNTGTAFATTYYMLSMIKAIQMQVTEPDMLRKGLLSPTFVYQKTKPYGDRDCHRRINIEGALITLKDIGTVSLETLPYIGCRELLPGLEEKAKENRIYEALQLFSYSELPPNKTRYAKKALSEGFPIVIGIPVKDSSIRNFRGKVWKPNHHVNMPGDSGDVQAFCLVGYDNDMDGGAFRIVNSRGEKWGENGLCWIRYADFEKYCRTGYQVIPIPMKAHQSFAMKGEANFMHSDGKWMKTRRDLLVSKNTYVTADKKKTSAGEIMVYSMLESYPSGTSFKLFINTGMPSYMYVMGSDSTLKVSKLIPVNDTSPIMPANSLLIFPSDTTSITMDATIGNDYLLFLFSVKPLSFSELASQIESSQGTFVERTLKVMHKELIPPDQIKYNETNVGFEVSQVGQGSVVPLLVRIKHI